SDQEPVAGATVKAKGTTIGTQTNADGEFSLTIPASVKTLEIAFIGMFPVEVAVKPNLTVYMEENETVIDEVVVTGYGSTKKAAFTGAASVVNGDVVDRKSDVNFVKSLEGQVTGFQYNSGTSSPGTWSSVYIRGMGSLSSSSYPLYVIDGIPVNSDFDAMDSDSNNSFDPMAAYNPSDIESVTVLKDAAATAIYGSRAANGVIVITTKKGGQSKLNVTFETRQGFVSMGNNNMKFANAQSTMDLFAKGMAARTGLTYDYTYNYYLDKYAWDGKTDTDWIDVVTRKGYYSDYNLSFNGTVGTTNYYANLNYNKANGLVIASDNTRYSGRVNLDTKYKFISVGINTSYSYSINNGAPQDGSFVNPLNGALGDLLPMYAPYVGEGADRRYDHIADYNPLAIWDPELGNINEVTNQTINANPWMRIDFGKGIWAKTNFGANIMDQRQYDYWSAVYNPQAWDYNGVGQQYNSKTTTLTWTNTLGWNYKFGENAIDLLFGQEMQRYNYWYEYYAGTDFPFADSGMRDLTTAGNTEMGAQYYKSESRLASYFMDLHYSFADRYYVSGSYRRDGSSVFGAKKRWGNFWSVGGKWRVTEEAFLKGNRALTNLALRISYGTVGNQSLPSLYAARGYYAAGYNYAGAPGMVPAQISNPNLTWETSKKFDVGFDASLFNRVNFTFDYYNELTDDALYSVPLSYTTGLGSSYRNIGKIRNSGIEFGVNGTAFYNNDILVTLFGNITWNKNKVVKLANGSITGSYQIIEEGRPYRQYYLPEYYGVDPETGKALFYKNAPGTVDDAGNDISDELTTELVNASKRYLGSAEPKVFGAFGLNANAYGFDLSMQFNYRLGAKVYNAARMYTGWGMDEMNPLQTVVDNSWTPENPNAKYPQYIYGDPNNTLGHSSRWLMNGSYLRLSNITFGYTLPAKLTHKALMQKVRFYTTFDNIHTWTASDFIGYNPETYSTGIITWQYPSIFTFTGGVQITF
ncbi:MAG: SusC/RagA family TonB-linked outer membrane protein, partial [Paramuribaculum sp.]|nr:SusC/RagA family TonB-linked outer membrane protein [Paramuribaculum sp.]